MTAWSVFPSIKIRKKKTKNKYGLRSYMGDLLYLQHAAKSHPEFGVKIWQKSPKSMAFLYFNIKTFLFEGFFFFKKGTKT